MSEEDVRAIVRDGAGKKRPRAGNGRAASFGGILLAVVAGSLLLLHTEPVHDSGDGVAGNAAQAGQKGYVVASADPLQSVRVDARSAQASVAASGLSPQTAMGRSSMRMTRPSFLHRSFDQENHAMMRSITSRLTAASAALISAATVTTSAQIHNGADREQEPPPVIQQMQVELGMAVSDYWTVRLNDYKVRIDQALAPKDLAELNRLRVRFTVLAMEWLGSEKGAKEMQSRAERKQALGQLIDIYKAAKEMSARYRPELDGLATTVVGDFGEFLPEINRHADDFIASRRDEIDRAGRSRMLAEARSKADEVAVMLRSEQGRTAVRMLYTMTLEPIVMLYDGTDLKTFWQQVEQVSSGGIKLPSGAIAGYTLPAGSLLKPNMPNPASSVTTIAYTLPEPSEETMLRVYDAHGALVATYDEGAKGSGDHAVQIDVSGVIPGTYLYHLTVRTPGGSRVYSRTMQVVR